MLPDEFFGVWVKFIQSLDRAGRDNYKEKLQQEQINKRNAAKKVNFHFILSQLNFQIR